MFPKKPDLQGIKATPSDTETLYSPLSIAIVAGFNVCLDARCLDLPDARGRNGNNPDSDKPLKIDFRVWIAALKLSHL